MKNKTKCVKIPFGNNKQYIPSDQRKKQKEREERRQKGYSKASRDGFYNSSEWRTLRSGYIAENPLCEHCKQYGKLTPGQVVDHIKPVHLNPELSLDWDNLQTLCHSCHARKTHRDRRDNNEPYGSDLQSFLEDL